MTESLTATFNLSKVQREELQTCIKFILDNDKSIKRYTLLQKFIFDKSEGAIQWRDTAIAQFQSNASALNLPANEQRHAQLFQLITEKAKSIGYGAVVDPRYEGKDPDLYALLQQIFKIPEEDPSGRKRRVLAVSVAYFTNVFEQDTGKTFNTDSLRTFINSKGAHTHRFSQSVRDALCGFAKKCLEGEIQLKSNALLGNAEAVTAPSVV